MSILFLEDWKRYPGAIVHESTKNHSFLRLAALYKKMGIENHLFHLSLLNPELEHVDPFDPELTIEQMVSVAIECRMNVWYYLREVLRVPAIAGADDSPLIANRGNIAIYWLFMNHIFTTIIQIRQTGKTLTLSSLLCYLLDIGGQNTMSILLTKDDSLRSITLDRIRDIESSLPNYLIRRTKNDISNTEKIKVSELNNELNGLISSLSEKQALKTGRGATAPIFLIDEAAFIPNITIALPSALAAGGAARDIAARNNSFYGTILSTTAGKLDDKDGKYVYDILQDSLTWTEKLFDCENVKDLDDLIRKNNKGISRVSCVFSHRQLGFTDEWLKRKIEEANVTGEECERDFFNKWTSGNVRSPLGPEQLDIIKSSAIEPIYTEVCNNGYILNWYLEENTIEYNLNNESHVLGLDSSDASGGDDIALVIKSIRSGKVICGATFNETNIIDFCIWLCQFLVKYKKVTAIIERRSTGSTIIDYLLKMLPNYNEDPYTRLFNRVVNDRENDIERFKMALLPLYRKDTTMLIQDKKHFGFATSGSGITNRSELYGMTLLDAAKKTGKYVQDSKLVGEIVGLVVKNNRVDHDTGKHDDLVIAWLLCHWFMTHGQNLDVYGIRSAEILIENRISNIKEGVTQYDIDRDLKIKQEIDELIVKISDCNDENLSYMYEKQIKALMTKIKNEDIVATMSIDDLLNKIKSQKRLDNSIKPQTNYNMYRDTRPAYEASSYLFGNFKF